MRLLLIAILTTLSFTAIAGGSKTRSISGTVVGVDLESLAGAKVEVKGTDISVYADLNGEFKIENLKPGIYDLVITMVSYQELEVEQIYLSAPSTQLQLHLQSR